MIKISTAHLWVHDQDEALEFYTKKVGWEVRADVTVPELGNFRWLTVGPAGQPDIAVALMTIPGEPVMDEQTAGQVRELVGKGFAGTIFLTTEDVHADFRDLQEPRSRVRGRADRPALRHRLLVSRPVRRPHALPRCARSPQSEGAREPGDGEPSPGSATVEP